MKKIINGYEKLNRYHFQLSMGFAFNPGNRYLNTIEYHNDLEFENHQVKLLKYKQYCFLNKIPLSYR